MHRGGLLLLCAVLTVDVNAGCSETPRRRSVGDGSVAADTAVGDASGRDDAGDRCTVFPASDPWNTVISDHDLHPSSADIINRIGADIALHPDFGTVWQGEPNGIPFVNLAADQAPVPVSYQAYGNESDPGPFPLPLDAPIEAGSDRHVIGVDLTHCKLYELFHASVGDGGWEADSGAVFDLKRNSVQRPIGWTSADAAGLPIYPGLVRYDEVASGEIRHALRVTFEQTRRALVLPATHWASDLTASNLPPMGLRLRLKAEVDISGYAQANQVILRALKAYGMIVADNGGDWYLSGAPDSRWDDDELRELTQLQGSDFQVVDTGPIYIDYDDVPR